MKTCSKCRQEKPLDQFGLEARAKDGHRYSCLECNRQRHREYSARVRPMRKEYRRQWGQENREKERVYSETYRLKWRARDLVQHARRRSRMKNIPFDLDQHLAEIQTRIDAGKCELSGIPFNLGPGKTFDSPSLDRIDPKKGYVYSNIRVLCVAMNSALGDWGEEVLARVISGWKKGA